MAYMGIPKKRQRKNRKQHTWFRSWFIFCLPSTAAQSFQQYYVPVLTPGTCIFYVSVCRMQCQCYLILRFISLSGTATVRVSLSFTIRVTTCQSRYLISLKKAYQWRLYGICFHFLWLCIFIMVNIKHENLSDSLLSLTVVTVNLFDNT